MSPAQVLETIRQEMRRFKEELWRVLQRGPTVADYADVADTLDGMTPDEVIDSLKDVVNVHIDKKGINIHQTTPTQAGSLTKQEFDAEIAELLDPETGFPLSFLGDFTYHPPQVLGSYNSGPKVPLRPQVAMEFEEPGYLTMLRTNTHGQSQQLFYSRVHKPLDNKVWDIEDMNSEWRPINGDTVDGWWNRILNLNETDRISGIVSYNGYILVAEVRTSSDVLKGYMIAQMPLNFNPQRIGYANVWPVGNPWLGGIANNNGVWNNRLTVVTVLNILNPDFVDPVLLISSRLKTVTDPVEFIVYAASKGYLTGGFDAGGIPTPYLIPNIRVNRGTAGITAIQNKVVLFDRASDMVRLGPGIVVDYPTNIDHFVHATGSLGGPFARICFSVTLTFTKPGIATQGRLHGVIWFQMEYNKSGQIIDISHYWNNRPYVDVDAQGNWTYTDSPMFSRDPNALAYLNTDWRGKSAAVVYRYGKLYKCLSELDGSGDKVSMHIFDGVDDPEARLSIQPCIPERTNAGERKLVYPGPMTQNFHSAFLMSATKLVVRCKAPLPTDPKTFQDQWVTYPLSASANLRHTSATGRWTKYGYALTTGALQLPLPISNSTLLDNLLIESVAGQDNNTVSQACFSTFYNTMPITRSKLLDQDFNPSGTVGVLPAVYDVLRVEIAGQLAARGYTLRGTTAEYIGFNLCIPQQFTDRDPFIMGVAVTVGGNQVSFICDITITSGSRDSITGASIEVASLAVASDPIANVSGLVPDGTYGKINLRRVSGTGYFVIGCIGIKSQIPGNQVYTVLAANKPSPAGTWVWAKSSGNVTQATFHHLSTAMFSVLSSGKVGMHFATSSPSLPYNVDYGAKMVGLPSRTLSGSNEIIPTTSPTEIATQLANNGSGTSTLGDASGVLVWCTQATPGGWRVWTERRVHAMVDGLYQRMEPWSYTFNPATDANTTWRIWLVKIGGQINFRLSRNTALPTGVDGYHYVGTVVTGSAGILSVTTERTPRIAGKTLSMTKRGAAIPVTRPGQVELDWFY